MSTPMQEKLQFIAQAKPSPLGKAWVLPWQWDKQLLDNDSKKPPPFEGRGWLFDQGSRR